MPYDDSAEARNAQLFAAVARAVRDAALDPQTKDQVFDALHAMAADLSSSNVALHYGRLGTLCQRHADVRATLKPFMTRLAALLH